MNAVGSLLLLALMVSWVAGGAAVAAPAKEQAKEDCASSEVRGAAVERQSGEAGDRQATRKNAVRGDESADKGVARGKEGCARKAVPRSGRYSPPVSIERLPPPPSGIRPPSPAAQAPDLTPRAPTAINSCDAGGCWGSGGERYQGGTGNVYLNGSGRQCLRIGTTMQCN